jgi:hypothetical protein
MTEEVQQALAEVESAPAPEATAAPENAQNAPAEENSEKTPRVYTEEEFNLHTQKQREGFEKKLAKEQRKWEREQQAKLAQPQAPREVPPIDQFESPDAYAEALAVRKAEELIAQRDFQRQQAEINDAYHDREEEARAKYDDFEQVAYNPQLRVTDVMAETIKASDMGPDLAYWLGTNPKEADRISRLAPLLQAREIGKIEAKLGSNPLVKPTTSAPAPISPVTARTSGSPSYDTTDPRSTKTMTDSQWIEAERARQMKKLQAQMNR